MKNRESLWWAIALLMGVTACRLPDLLMPNASVASQLLVREGALFLVGLFLGCMKGEQAWCWGVSFVVLFPLIDMVRMTPEYGSLSPGVVVMQLVPRAMENTAVYFLQGVTAVLGCAYGASLA